MLYFCVSVKMAFLRSASRLCSVYSNTISRATIHSSSRNYAELSLTFSSPQEVFYSEQVVRQVDVPGMTSNFGILAEHVPTLAVLKPGLVNVIENDGKASKFFVSSGSVTVNADSSVQVLAEVAVPVDRIDAQAVTAGLTKAQQAMSSASGDKAKAEAQVAVECFEALKAIA